MKKLFAAAALAVMLISGTAFAADPVYSPIATEVPPTPPKEQSPKTGDFNVLIVEILGAALAVTAVVSGTRARRHA